MLASSSRSSFQRVSSHLLHRIASGHSRQLATAVQSHSHEADQTSYRTASSSSQLSREPWNFQTDFDIQKSRNRSNVARLNMLLANSADRRQITPVFKTLADMKRNGIAPNLDTYNTTLRVVAKFNLSGDAWAVFDDMVIAGVKPDVQSFNSLLAAHQHRNSLYLWPIIRTMEKMGVEPNATTYKLIINYFLYEKSVECVLRYFHIMKTKGIEPELHTVQQVIELVAQEGYARLALDLATSFESESPRRLEPVVWLYCLASAAECLWKDGVTRCWEYVTQDLSLIPEEGLCIYVLHTAARHGLPDLATDVLRVLKLSGVSWQEYHLAPVVEAFCKVGQIKEAFMTLDIMRDSGIEVLATTVAPVISNIKKDSDTFDAIWPVVDEMHQEKTLHLSSLNIIIKAAVALGDLQRAIGAYKSFSDYGFAADLDTYHLLLEGALSARHQPLGDLIFSDMKEAGISPDQRAFALMIDLCLTPDTYEDAFLHLEEMKGAGFTPSDETYKNLASKCASSGDSRYTIVLDEMKEMGYDVPLSFAGDMGSLFRKATQWLENNSHPGLEGSARRFIETGGLKQ